MSSKIGIWVYILNVSILLLYNFHLQCAQRHMYRKAVRETAGEDIWTKKYFSRAHVEERKELDAGLIAGGVNRSLVVGGERDSRWMGPGNSN
jgi:hypothetical protein